MLDDFLIRAALGGLGLILAAAPLGCFLVWRRMAYFGDATAHAALLGVALALAFDISIFAGVLTITLGASLMVHQLSERGFGMDTLLGTFAHSALALGLVAVSLTQELRGDLSAYLFGDILAITRADLAVIWAGGLAVLGITLWRWQALLTVTLSPELAQASGINPKRETMILTLGLAVTVAVAIKVVGALLIIALMLIPAASARAFSRSPEAMALSAALIGAGAVLGGIAASYHFDTPTGPSIVCVAACAFGAALIGGALRRA